MPSLPTELVATLNSGSTDDTAVLQIDGETIHVSALPMGEGEHESVEVVIGEDAADFLMSANQITEAQEPIRMKPDECIGELVSLYINCLRRQLFYL